MDFYTETYGGFLQIGLKLVRTLYQGQSDFQKVTVIETEKMGRALLLDDAWMTSEGDEKYYHEMIVHPALTVAPSIARVLVIGGGDGGTVREVLRYSGVQHVDMVEIDGDVIAVSKEFLPSIGTAWNDPRLHVIVGDGIAHVANHDGAPYDVILVDSSDPVGPAEGLFNEAFYTGCRRILSPNGVLVVQSESPTIMTDVHLQIVKTLGTIFAQVRPYYGPVVLYPGAQWSWTWASAATLDPFAPDAERAEAIEANAHVYNRDIQRAAFALPNHIKRALEA